MDPSRSLQDQFSPKSRCFGCGPANERGLRIKSFVRGDEVVARFTPEEHHQAFEGMLNGGIIGALLDCHGNWTAAYTLMRRDGSETPPCTVTAEFAVTLAAPTPLAEVRLVARPAEIGKRKVVVDAELWSGDRRTATCRGIFVAVREDHPAYHRW
ncbi:MAG: PaaI family thioesterase [Pseudomonadota bacterium]|nr:MAG: PaaI family thioesterase [Pseudomonadota bacterium]